MQQMLIIFWLGLLAIGAARPTVAASLVPAGTPFRIYQGFGAPFDGAAVFAGTPFAAPLAASPLAVSSSQRLDYFNQFNAAYAPTITAPGRLLTAAGPFSGQFPAVGAAPARFIQPGRLIAPGVAAPFFF